MLLKNLVALFFFSLASFSLAAATPPAVNPKTSLDPALLKDSALQYWYEKIRFAGQVNAAGFTSNTTPTTRGLIPPYVGNSPAASDINIPIALLSATSNPASWSEVSLALAYAQRSPSFIRSPAGGGEVFFVDSAYIKFENAAVSPFILKWDAILSILEDFTPGL